MSHKAKAPSRRPASDRIARRGLLRATLAAGVLAALLVAAPAAQAGKAVIGSFGAPAGSGKGQLREPSGIAVNAAGAGGVSPGDVYVVDSANNRIEEFSAAGAFVRAFGRNVVASGPDDKPVNDEVQSIAIKASSGAFTLSFGGFGENVETTLPLAFDAPAASVETALNALSGIGGKGGGVSVTGGPGDATGSSPYRVTFGGALADKDVPQIEVNAAGLGVAAGAQLSCSDRANATTKTFQWLRNGAEISGATASTYTTTPADASAVIQCQSAAANANAGAIAVSPPTAAAETVASPYPATAPPALKPGALGGAFVETLPGVDSQVGNPVNCKAISSSWAGSPTFAYQWYSNGVAIPGATATTYHLQAADVPGAIQCAVTAANAGGSATFVSEPVNTDPEPSPRAPTASATVAPPSAASTLDDGGSYEICAVADVCQAGEGVGSAGALRRPSGVAIDQTNGNVYVTDSESNSSFSNSRVDVYSATGAFEGAFGWGVDESNSKEELQFCTAITGCQSGTAGAGAGQLSPGEKRSLPAIDPNNGHLYLGSNNNRLDEFAPALNGSGEVTGVSFVRALGWDVVESGPDDVPAAHPAQKLTIPPSVTGGSFTLTFEGKTTKALPFNTGASNLASALNAIDSIKAFESPFDTTSIVSATLKGSGEFELAFRGFLDFTPVPPITVDSAKLAGGAATVSTISAGASPYESCDVAAHPSDVCKEGIPGGHLGQFGEQGSTLASGPLASVAVDSSGAIYAANEVLGTGLLSIDAPIRVQKFDPSGASPQEFAPAQLTAIKGQIEALNDSSVAVDPANDHVLVAKKTDLERFKILEFDSSGDLLETYGGEAGLKGGSFFNAPAIAVGAGERLYVTSAGQVDILGPPPPPTVTIGPVTDVSATSAAFSGTVTPPLPGPEGERFDTTYHFEYSTDGAHWSRVPAKEIDVGDGSGSGAADTCPTNNPPTCDVEQTATGLQPNAHYQARLVATDGSPATSGAVPFTTEPAKPSVSGTLAEEVGETSAQLTGFVNPNNDATTYRFEWGTDASYGNRIPAEAEESVGSGGEAVKVSADLTGLKAAGAYHFRIVATNSSGATEGPDQEFSSLDSAGLPDGRMPELVSPADKRPQGSVGSLADPESYAQSSADGSAFAFPILLGLGDSTAGGNLRYLASRGESGWQSSQVTPPALVADGQPTGFVDYYPSNLACAFVVSTQPLSADTPAIDTELGVWNLYRWNRADGAYTLISDTTPLNSGFHSTTEPLAHFQVAGAAPDCSRVYFRTPYQFIAGASGLYEWDEGTLRDAGLLHDGATPSGEAAPGGQFSYQGTRANSVSEDGSRFFFSATSDEGLDSGHKAVFARKGPGEVVDASKPTTATSSLGARYDTASPDGSQVFFIANYGIASTSSAGPKEDCSGEVNPYTTNACDLYDYDVETGQLSDISADTNGADTKGAVVEGVLDVSKDGSYVYFAAMGQLIPGKGKTYTENLSGEKSANVYLYHGSALSYVATLEGDDLGFADPLAQGGGKEGSALIHDERVWAARATPDGRHLLFASHADITGYESGGPKEAYLYSADTGKVVCVSCRRDGQPSIGAAFLGPLAMLNIEAQDGYHPRSLSADGRRVFFTSEDVLAPGAEAGANNVYEWESGQVYLLAALDPGHTPGGGDPREYLDASASGDDVFIAASRQLAPQDTDFAPDVYDLKVGGGFPFEQPKPPCDPAAGECHGEPKPPPASSNPASAGFTGPGDPPTPPPAKGKSHKKRHKKAHKRKAHRGHSRRAAKANRGGVK